MNYETTLEIEVAIAKFFKPRIHLIVPNIWWGLGIHECDLLVITKSSFATEIEIKVSASDLKRDNFKRHQHNSNLIKRLFFAIPETLLEHQTYIPNKAGIITVNKEGWCKLIRKAEINKFAKPLNLDQILHLGRLASMRIWTLKQTLINRKP